MDQQISHNFFRTRLNSSESPVIPLPFYAHNTGILELKQGMLDSAQRHLEAMLVLLNQGKIMQNYEIKIDGNVIEGREIILKNDGKIYNVEVQI